ncbi:ROK family protein [Seonamhaeicola aphaedonensis]|uniref:Glucokinase n=1 Tax=Seonamhaeicola aphaedonensis TaxID=1461338 RepID=A0A3D9HDF2_9FLAO|nr:ROK family protein [Seonamhaeicola aphaedonensis]RED47512.1 glucokinase [Seonamhaeicola aphaedonensis]
MKNIAIGVDIGGSHISCMGFNLETKKLLPESFVENSIDNHAMPDAIISTWGHVIKQSINKIGINRVSGIGFAMPGPFDYANGISLFSGQNGKYEHTYGIDVKNMLTDFLNLKEPLKIRFINDASAFALGEAKFGSAKTNNSILSITLGTGFGSAFIKNGVPVVNGNEVPKGGCLWHLPFENATADDYFSTRGLIERFEQKTGHKCKGVKDIVDLCGTNSDAKQLLEDFGEKMASFLHPWVRKSKVETVVFGGNISRAYQFFGKSLKSYLNSVDLPVNIIVSQLKEKSAFMGSAVLIDDKLYESIFPVLQKM